MKIKYVVGFMFDKTISNVALIRKLKPEFQKGLLNGIGGKVEDNESFDAAMIREFFEEAGFITLNWKNFCLMQGKNNDNSEFQIEFYYIIGELEKLISMTDEKLEIVKTNDVILGKEKVIGNLPWLVALCLDFKKGVHPPSKIVAIY
jgi:8-oxo-dGTP diphosphatase